ncbi:MAG: hypothetical protein Ta2B_16790 [Termitinemataceae bacterium]|nr:MAG: hypothetical protein Ta2B_16790 [Termitinemataceae bacterium]
MKNKRFGSLFAIFLCLSASAAVYAETEKTITLKGMELWNKINVADNVSYLNGVRPSEVISLTSTKRTYHSSSDLIVNFDEGEVLDYKDITDHYTLTVSDAVSAVPQRYARIGRGAVLFAGDSSVSYLASNSRGQTSPLTIRAKNRSALFSAENALSSFSIEFYLYPNSLESGEEVITWNATHKELISSGNAYVQNINFFVSKNRTHWDFTNFFTSVDNTKSLKLKLSSKDPLVPKTWSYHMLRYDSESGIIEYVVNGIVQDLKNTIDGNEVFAPFTGDRGSFVLGKNFNGMLDDFKILSSYQENFSTKRYPASGGRMETIPIDLGAKNSKTLNIDITGGRVNAVAGGINESQKNGVFKFKDDSQIQFFIRCSNSPYDLLDQNWQIFNTGKQLQNVNGRYVQIAADLYPSGNCENTPYIEEIKIVYTDKSAPSAPTSLFARALDGSVELTWKDDPASYGYVIYYGTESGIYFCEDALQGPSPFDAGKCNSLTINGLKNGVLYYFAICGYGSDSTVQSSFSREVRARPLMSRE